MSPEERKRREDERRRERNESMIRQVKAGAQRIGMPPPWSGFQLQRPIEKDKDAIRRLYGEDQ